MDETNFLYSAYVDDCKRFGFYRPSTGELIRKLKGLPEWAGLSTGQAHRAIAIGLGKIKNDGRDPWELLPDNEIKEISAEEDFIEAWPEVRGSSIDLPEVVRQAQASPIRWSQELQDMLAPVTPQFKLFCDICMCLQSMVGRDAYILLPQHQLASLLGTKQGGISSYCNRAKKAGFLEELNDGRWSHAQHQAKHWRCTSHLERNLVFSNADDIPY